MCANEVGFQTVRLPGRADAVAPDGSEVRVLLAVAGGGLAHFELGAGETSIAVEHRTVEEIWYFLRGTGEVWRRSADQEEVVAVSADVCITIPLGTRFQFRSVGREPLAAVGATIPRWPGAGEATVVEGPWEPTVKR
ncbi:MAG TPA: cupin domain-containing protein [Solirubrobacteraceae bacterium]|nr:cupin domain-containing protein [Solirubrobacteraceae bacterium]